MRLASYPFGFTRAACLILAEVELAYGRSVLDNDGVDWWWEIPAGDRAEVEAVYRCRSSAADGDRGGESLVRLLGIPVRFVEPRDPKSIGRLTLNCTPTSSFHPSVTKSLLR